MISSAGNFAISSAGTFESPEAANPRTCASAAESIAWVENSRSSCSRYSGDKREASITSIATVGSPFWGFSRFQLAIVIRYDVACQHRKYHERQTAQEARRAEISTVVRPAGPRRLQLPQLGQGQGRAARPVRRPARDRHLQHVQRTDALQFAFP